jgi:non-lysosomal glucosylceramidase
MPIGGIGTGTISLGGRGDLRDWEIMNRPDKGFTPGNAFFAISYSFEGGESGQLALEGPLDPVDFEGGFGVTQRNHGLPRFDSAEFRVAYPLATIQFSTKDIPLEVRLEAFNPLVPADTEASGYPVAYLRYVVRNTGDKVVKVCVVGSIPNIIGKDQAKNNFCELVDSTVASGVLFRSRGVDLSSPTFGTMALAALEGEDVSRRTAWADRNWGDSLLDFWDDLSDQSLENRSGTLQSSQIGSVCHTKLIAPNAEESFEFVVAWHFPNRQVWHPASDSGEVIGNYYTERFSDAWDAASQFAVNRRDLEDRTVRFVESFVSSALPEVVKEAALFNLSTLRTQTCFRTPDGNFFGWEGCGDTSGCCEGSCTHVWNYEQATGFLFGSLARSMRRIEFLHATGPDGCMSFRVRLPLETRSKEFHLAAADGQMGCLMKLYRDWKLSGDNAFLFELWPHAKRALEFCWLSDGWDADQDGLMEGCQHNTMDVEYYGPNPQMTSWYLGALRVMVEMASANGDSNFGEKCRSLFESGRAKMDSELFNGEYYEHFVMPPRKAPRSDLRYSDMGAQNLDNPELQLASGCLIDQLVGCYMAEVVGVGPLVNVDHVNTTLQTLMRRNYRERLVRHFNHMRTFALQDESAMVMAWYPEDRRPERPFPYFNEVMTGFEYTAAAHMMFVGLEEDGIKLVKAIRNRYDGLRRNPFDEAECGHHYARAMASWACIIALTGFQYDGRTGVMAFRDPGEANWFWSSGDAWGLIRIKLNSCSLEVIEGQIRVHSIRIGSRQPIDLAELQS